MKRLDDVQLEALFCAHWQKTRDLVASLRLVIDASTLGAPRAVVRASAKRRISNRGRAAAVAHGRAKAADRARPILELYAAESGVEVEDIIARHGTTLVSRVRYEAMWVLRKLAGMSYPEIGFAVGGRSHSDALRAVRKTEARIATDDVARARLQAFVKPAQRRRAA